MRIFRFCDGAGIDLDEIIFVGTINLYDIDIEAEAGEAEMYSFDVHFKSGTGGNAIQMRATDRDLLVQERESLIEAWSKNES